MQIIKREDIPEKRQVRLTIAVDRDTWRLRWRGATRA